MEKNKLINNKLILISDVSKPLVEKIFLSINQLKLLENKTAVFLFLEASTRTKISFEMACYKLGVKVVHFNLHTSSTTKGENLVETLRNIEAMGADLLVVRHGHEIDIANLYKLHIPVISAGSASLSHPTQALLDLYTLQQEKLTHQNKKLLFLGDISVNRVAQSHQNLLTHWGFEMAYCYPSECEESKGFEKLDLKKFNLNQVDLNQSKKSNLNQSTSSLKYFKDKEEALAWADIVMVLRLQKERKDFSKEFLENYTNKYQLTLKNIEKTNLKKSNPLKIMHPGPFVEGLDLEQAVTTYEHSFIYKQVRNSVLVRAAIIQSLLEED